MKFDPRQLHFQWCGGYASAGCTFFCHLRSKATFWDATCPQSPIYLFHFVPRMSFRCKLSVLVTEIGCGHVSSRQCWSMLFCFASRMSNPVHSRRRRPPFFSPNSSHVCLGWLCPLSSLWLVTRAKATRSIVNLVLVSCRTRELWLFVLVFVLWHLIMIIM